MKDAPHHNSHKNQLPHHLYEIYDKKDDDVFKYGISCDPIDSDGQSKRIRNQLTILNLAAGWIRFFARILLKGIPGRKKAEAIEDEYIDRYEAANGKRPRGNLRKNRNN